jgi:hypothetical protein
MQSPCGHFVLQSPPGHAVLMAEDLNEMDPRPQWLEKLPAWADGEESAAEKKQRQLAHSFREMATQESISAAVDKLLASSDPEERRAGIYALAAMDELKRFREVLAQTSDHATWDAWVIALRHWIGRGPGQDQKLYQALIERKGYKPAEAEVVLGLLHSFSEEERCCPEVYEVLIDYLHSKHLAIRGLACWHLHRLVPAGRKIGYDPVAPPAERKRAVETWKKLIPSGKMPPPRTGHEPARER